MKKHSKRYKANRATVESGKVYTIVDAVTLLKQHKRTKFDESLELHARLGIDTKKAEQSVRGTLQLPHGTGKTQRIAVFADEALHADAKKAGADIIGADDLIAQIQKTEKIEFDVAVATPQMMPKLGRIARILGPKGLMPSPKTQTVTPDVVKAIEALKKGKVDFKADPDGNIHQILGKMSFSDEQLQQNVEAFLEELKRAKPEHSKGDFILGLTLTTTMGPGIPIK